MCYNNKMEQTANIQADKKAITHDNDINQVNDTQVFDPYNNQNNENFFLKIGMVHGGLYPA